MAEPVAVAVIQRWEDIPEDLHADLEALAVAAARCHDPNVVSISAEQLRKMAQKVFNGGWSTKNSLRPPSMGKMRLHLGAIRVGKFTEDLPPSSKKQKDWDKNPDARNRYLANSPRSRPPQTQSARKQGRPAFFRPRLDKNDQVVHEYVDGTGKLAPVAYVAFDNGGDKLTANEIASAYRHADFGRENIAKDFNLYLCVYLWQKTISNAGPIEGIRDYTADDFVRPALIRNQLKRNIEDINTIADNFRANPGSHDSLFS